MTDEDLAECFLTLLDDDIQEHETPSSTKYEEHASAARSSEEDTDTHLNMIEVVPGLELPLRGSQETRQAFQDDFFS